MTRNDFETLMSSFRIGRKETESACLFINICEGIGLDIRTKGKSRVKKILLETLFQETDTKINVFQCLEQILVTYGFIKPDDKLTWSNDDVYFYVEVEKEQI